MEINFALTQGRTEVVGNRDELERLARTVTEVAKYGLSRTDFTLLPSGILCVKLEREE